MPTVLITGASSGIGAAAAALLAERGFRVFGSSRNIDRARERMSNVTWLRMDVTDERSVEDGLATIADAAGGIDALVCCAGFGIFGSIEETSLDRARAQFETNFFGTLIPIRAVLPAMRGRRAGRIVVVGSLAGRAPIPFQAH
jgi:NAD(P)-dependent dehydrogenase (short-subunit alcohol dehydrogenase family)